MAKRQSTRWYLSKPNYDSFGINPDQVLTHLGQRSPKTKYHIHLFLRPEISGSWRRYVAASTIKRMIDVGYRDMEIWGLTSPQLATPRMTAHGWRPSWGPASHDYGMIIDLDGSKLPTAHHVYRRIEQLGIARPRTVMTTSPGHYHLVFMPGDGPWTDGKRIAWAAAWAGVGAAVFQSDPWTWREAMKSSGIDSQHLVKPLGASEYRVPGSVNFKPSLCLDELGNVVRLVNVTETYWDRRAGRSCYVEWLDGVKLDRALVVPSRPAEPVMEQQLIDVSRNESRNNCGIEGPLDERQYQELLHGYPRAYKGRLSKVLYKNIGYLMRGDFRIQQTVLAQQLGIAQPSISRLLKRLVFDQILTLVDSSYMPKSVAKSAGYQNGWSKTYGIGAKLQEFINNIRPISDSPYDNGQTWPESSKDIRVLLARGWSADEVAKFCHRKSVDEYGKPRQSLQYFQARIINWERKLDFKKENQYVVYAGSSGAGAVGQAGLRRGVPPVGLEPGGGAVGSSTGAEAVPEPLQQLNGSTHLLDCQSATPEGSS